MESIRQYILSVVAVSVVCSIVNRIVGKGTSFGPIIRLTCGLFVALTALSHWVEFDLRDPGLFYEDYYAQAQVISQSAQVAADQSVAAIITDQTQAYILDKAISQGLDISVAVQLDESGKIPYSVKITGDVSPYDQSVLKRYIADTLAIPEERQLWM